MKRRDFIKNAAFGSISATLGFSSYAKSSFKSTGTAPLVSDPGAVSLIKGDSRTDNMYQALTMIGEEIKQSIGNKQVIIKPNMIAFTEDFPATHVDHLRAILEFLKPFYNKKVIIAESSPRGAALEGFRLHGYLALAKYYNIEWQDLNDAERYPVFILDKNGHPLRITIPKVLVDPNTYLISAARLKTHNSVVVTLSNKNITMGAPQIYGDQHHKRDMHQGTKEINYNLFLLTQKIPIHLATIDGFEGMEGAGPSQGDPVNSKIAIASTDFLAADRVAVECMDIDFRKIGYLNYCSDANMGQAELNKITLKGETIANCRKTYRLHDNINTQLMW